MAKNPPPPYTRAEIEANLASAQKRLRDVSEFIRTPLLQETRDAWRCCLALLDALEKK